jgi:hypothetical protein
VGHSRVSGIDLNDGSDSWALPTLLNKVARLARYLCEPSGVDDGLSASGMNADGVRIVVQLRSRETRTRVRYELIFRRANAV